MYFVMQLTFTALVVQVVAMNSKRRTSAKEACRALRYGKISKVATKMELQSIQEKYQLSDMSTVAIPMNLPRNL